MRIVTDNIKYAKWLKDVGHVSTYDFIRGEKADLLLLTGGADVDPELYGQPNVKSYIDRSRDREDMLLYVKALNAGIPIVGICRGNQFICSIQHGGMIIQDVTNHSTGGTHEIIINDNFKDLNENINTLQITSTHHQMAYPYNVDGMEIIAKSSPKISTHYLIGDERLRNEVYENIEKHGEPEIVWYPMVQALGIQGHPEFMDVNHPTCEFLRSLVDELFF